MKKLTTLFFACISIFSYAQYFQLTDTNGEPYQNGHTIHAAITVDDLDETGEYVTEIIVKNLTNAELEVSTLRTNVALPDGMLAYVCFGYCPADDVFDIEWTIGEEESFSLHLMPNEQTGLCKFQLVFSANEQTMTLFVEIDVHTVGINKYNNTNISLNAFPNPADRNSSLNVAYTLSDKSDDNQLVIRNIFGAQIMVVPLNAYENSVQIDTSPLLSGVYFYAIENKNTVSIAKKLIVK